MNAIKIEEINPCKGEGQGIVNTNPYGLIAYGSLAGTIRSCSSYLKERYIPIGLEDTYFSIEYMNMNERDVNREYVCKTVLDEILNRLDLSVTYDTTKKGLEIDFSTIGVSSNRKKTNPKDSILIEHGIEFFFMRLSDIFEIPFLMPDSKYKLNRGEKLVLILSLEEVAPCKNDVKGVKQLLEKHNIQSKVVDIPIFQIK